MISMTEAQKSAYMSDSAHKQIRLIFPQYKGGLTITNENIDAETMDINRSIMDGDELEVVGCISTAFSITIHDVERSDDLVGQLMFCDINANDTGWVRFFNGNVSSVEKGANRTIHTIKAYDALHDAMNVDMTEFYNNHLACTLNELIREVLPPWDYADFNLPNGNMIVPMGTVHKVESISKTDLLKSICQIAGCFGYITGDNKFNIYVVSQQDDHNTARVPAYKALDYETYETVSITDVVIKESDSDEGMRMSRDTIVKMLWETVPESQTFSTLDEYKAYYASNLTPYSALISDSDKSSSLATKDRYVFDVTEADGAYTVTPVGISWDWTIRKAIRQVIKATGMMIDYETAEVRKLISDTEKALLAKGWFSRVGGVVVMPAEEWIVNRQFVDDCMGILMNLGLYPLEDTFEWGKVYKVENLLCDYEQMRQFADNHGADVYNDNRSSYRWNACVGGNVIAQYWDRIFVDHPEITIDGKYIYVTRTNEWVSSATSWWDKGISCLQILVPPSDAVYIRMTQWFGDADNINKGYKDSDWVARTTSGIRWEFFKDAGLTQRASETAYMLVVYPDWNKPEEYARINTVYSAYYTDGIRYLLTQNTTSDRGYCFIPMWKDYGIKGTITQDGATLPMKASDTTASLYKNDWNSYLYHSFPSKMVGIGKLTNYMTVTSAGASKDDFFAYFREWVSSMIARDDWREGFLEKWDRMVEEKGDELPEGLIQGNYQNDLHSVSLAFVPSEYLAQGITFNPTSLTSSMMIQSGAPFDYVFVDVSRMNDVPYTFEYRSAEYNSYYGGYVGSNQSISRAIHVDNMNTEVQKVDISLLKLGKGESQAEVWNGSIEDVQHNVYTVLGNIFWYDQPDRMTMLYNLYNEIAYLADFSYRPFEASFPAMPWLECGDQIILTDKIDGEMLFRAFTMHIHGIGSIFCDASADGNQYQNTFTTSLGISLLDDTRAIAEEALEKANAASEQVVIIERDYATRAWTAEELAKAIEAINQFNIKILDSLPSTGEAGTLYFIKKTDPEQGDIYEEYMWLNNAWEKVGSTKIDLSDYVKKADLFMSLVNGIPSITFEEV